MTKAEKNKEIKRLERKLAAFEINYKYLQNDRAERAFTISKKEDEEILAILDEIAKAYKKTEEAIEQLKSA